MSTITTTKRKKRHFLAIATSRYRVKKEGLNASTFNNATKVSNKKNIVWVSHKGMNSNIRLTIEKQTNYIPHKRKIIETRMY